MNDLINVYCKKEFYIKRTVSFSGRQEINSTFSFIKELNPSSETIVMSVGVYKVYVNKNIKEGIDKSSLGIYLPTEFSFTGYVYFSKLEFDMFFSFLEEHRDKQIDELLK